jgi:aspartate racemase
MFELGAKNMKTIGLIGGTSWESTQEYYRIINEEVKKKLGGLHSAKIVLYSVDFEEIINFEKQEKWDGVAKIIIDAAHRVEKAGADFILICTNTLHKLADDVQKNINIPLIDLRDVTAESVKTQALKKVGLLGLKPTMQEEFYKGRLSEKHGIEVFTPRKEDAQIVHDIILDELCLGKMNQSSKEQFKRIIQNLGEKGAEGIVLGCTEIPLLVKQNDVNIPLFDTLTLHAKSAVEHALQE